MAFQRLFVALGGGDEIGASSYLLQANGKRVLIDAGLRLRGSRVYPDFPFVSQIGMLGLWECDCVCLTHAHLDHSGALPAVHQKAPEIPLYATPPTKDIAAILLRDTVKIAHKKGMFQGDVQIRRHSQEAVQNALKNLIVRPYSQSFEAAPDIQIAFYPAGHILGAAMVLVEIGEFHALFTGDFGGDGQVTVPGYHLPDPLPPIDLMVCESTYAYRRQASEKSLVEQQRDLLGNISNTVSQGGKVLVPAFAVGRSQEILLLLRQAFADQQVDPFPVWSDGMVNQVCQVYDKHRGYLRSDSQETIGDVLFDAELGIQPAPFTRGGPDFASQLDKEAPCCIVASSGMLVNGSRSASYASRLIEEKRNRILFTGYLDEESPGKGLLNAIARKPRFKINGKEHTVRADVKRYHLSAHASLDQIVSLVERVKPKNVVFVHGQSSHAAKDSLFSRLHHLATKGIHPVMARNNRPVVL